MFDINGDDIALLNDTDLRELIGRLCEAEMRRRGLSSSFVKSGGNQNAPDGGLDVRVTVSDSMLTGQWIPRPDTGFQVKKQKMPPSKVRAEMRPSHVLRPVIQELADRSGAYVIVSSGDSTSGPPLRDRRRAMAEALEGQPNARSLVLDFYDRGLLATWVRDHEGLFAWVREKIGKPFEGWRSHGPWADASGDARGEYLSDNKLRIRSSGTRLANGVPAIEGLQQIRDCLQQPGRVARLIGLSGVGKTRLLQALFEVGGGGESLDPSLAFYANVADSPDPTPTELASQMIAKGNRAIFVIDNCPPDLHRRVAEVCRSPGSTASAITVEYDIQDDEPEGTEVFRLDTSSLDLIEKLIRRRFPDISHTDAKTIANFSDGNARVAIALAGTVGKNETIEGLKDHDLLVRLIEQRRGPDKSLMEAAQVCSLVYSFDGQETGAESELTRLGNLIEQNTRELHRHVADLLERGVAQRRGGWRAILPHAIANRLAVTALVRISSSAINAQLIDSAPERLLKSFSRRLGYLHTSDEAVEIAKGWLKIGGLLGDVNSLSDAQKAMFENVAPTAPEQALEALERSLTQLDDVETLWRGRGYVRIIRSLAYDSALFPRCVALLSKLAAGSDLHENSNYALKALTSLFQVRFSGTHSPIKQRLKAIRSLLCSDRTKEQAQGVKALESVLEACYLQPFGDFEFGARSRDYGYWPSSPAEVRHWFSLSLKWSAALACSDQPIAQQVRLAIAKKLRWIWVSARAYNEVEYACRDISLKGFWPEGWIAVREIQNHETAGMPPDVSARLEAVEVLLRPKDLTQRVRSLVLSGDHQDAYLIDVKSERDKDLPGRTARLDASAEDLGRSVAADEQAFDKLVLQLVRHRGRLWCFGRGLAQGTHEPIKIWDGLARALAATRETLRNVHVLQGFLQAVHEMNPELANVILDSALCSDPTASCLPSLQVAVGIDERGIARLMRSLSLALTAIESYRVLGGGGASDLIPANQFRLLVLEIAAKPNGFSVAADILCMRLSSPRREGKVNEPEVIDAGRELIRRVPFSCTQNDSLDYDLGVVSRSCLGGNEGRAVVWELCSRLKGEATGALANAFYFDDLIAGLFTIQPTAALDALCGGDDKQLQSGLDLLRQLRRMPLDFMPESELFDWCDQKPAFRYPMVASKISIVEGTNQGEPQRWTPLSLHLLDKAPDHVAVLAQYSNQLGSIGWDASLAATETIKLLGVLRSHKDPSVRQFVAKEIARLGNVIDSRRKADREAQRKRDESFE